MLALRGAAVAVPAAPAEVPSAGGGRGRAVRAATGRRDPTGGGGLGRRLRTAGGAAGGGAGLLKSLLPDAMVYT